MNEATTLTAEKVRTKRYPVRLSIDIYDLVPIILFVVILSIIMIMKPRLFNINFFSVKVNAGLTMVLATVAQSLCMLSGGIDLSIGGIISLTNSLAATQMTENPGNVIMWCILILGIGIIGGAVNGIVISKLKVAPFIATLASWSVFNGLALLVLDDPGGFVSPTLKSWVRIDPFGIPTSFIVVIVLAIIWLFFKQTRFGTNIFAVGSEAYRSHLNGINVVRTQISVYMLSGFFAALAGLYRTVEISKGSPIAGDPFILTSVAAALVGGINLAGGRGDMINAILGGYIMLLLFDLVTFAGISSFYTPLVQGILLIFAVSLNIFGYRSKTRRALEQ